MINTRLVIRLEEPFKEEPFDLEIISIVVNASNGIIQVKEQEPFEDIEVLQEQINDYEGVITDLNGKIEQYEFLMDANDVDYDEY